ncbi:Rieske 2Fe-2S domain-containing protein [Luteimonas sp. SX5]|uniref:Rieske 2Fe-2S domain-containing protein n=1 Tax=Luteimonas galliterrae TaxID=2940486 RepID=A0ABT0MKH6_9GAMM|nr:Rieske 2Fe-2S domain-containing protein [Luteimonas galliterrae]MCL1635377.1 Rieske 2Fe-2S domain-containing protein [Luteimonas galliterrae]
MRGYSRQPLIALADIADGGFAEVEAALDGDAESLILYRDGQRVRAWLNVCPHAGRRLDWAPGKFLKSKEGLLVCAAHGASFELAEGLCVAGPCRGSHLRVVPVSVVDGDVWLGSCGSGFSRELLQDSSDP